MPDVLVLHFLSTRWFIVGWCNVQIIYLHFILHLALHANKIPLNKCLHSLLHLVRKIWKLEFQLRYNQKTEWFQILIYKAELQFDVSLTSSKFIDIILTLHFSFSCRLNELVLNIVKIFFGSLCHLLQENPQFLLA